MSAREAAVAGPPGAGLRAWLRTRFEPGHGNGSRRPFGFMGGPFTSADLGPVPAGWKVGPPDFVGVGVPKAGTSWWYSLITQHPKVAPHRLFDGARPLETKELHYFVHAGWRTIAEDQVHLYRRAFAAPPGGVCGEWSVLYLCQAPSLIQLARAVPETKVIAILRNPIDRMVSHVNHLMCNRARALNVRDEWRHFYEVFSAYPEAALHSQYGSPLRLLLARFPKERVLMLQYERCRLAPKEQLARTFRFLGVDDDFVPGSLDQPVNRQEHVIAPPGTADRAMLAEYFSDEVRMARESFPELDLDLWNDFKDL